MDIKEVRSRLQELSASKAASEARCAELEAQIAVAQSATLPVLDLREAVPMVERTLRGPMAPATRLFVEAAVASMTIDADRRVDLTLRVPRPGTAVSEMSSLVELGGIEPPSVWW